MGTILLAVLLSAMIGALLVSRRSQADRHRSALVPVRHMQMKNIRRNTRR